MSNKLVTSICLVPTSDLGVRQYASQHQEETVREYLQYITMYSWHYLQYSHYLVQLWLVFLVPRDPFPFVNLDMGIWSQLPVSFLPPPYFLTSLERDPITFPCLHNTRKIFSFYGCLTRGGGSSVKFILILHGLFQYVGPSGFKIQK